MQKFLFFLLGAVLFLNGRAQETIVHDPYAELRLVKGYHGIDVSNAIDLYLSQGQVETVAVSARDRKWRDRIRTEVVDGILVIRLDGKSSQLGNTKLKAYVSFTTLDRITANGASNVYVDGVVAGSKLSITLSGASDFKGAIKVDELQLKEDGASDAYLTGSVSGTASIQASGASDLKGYELNIRDCTVRASGASDIRITVEKELSADASGASSIYYKGDAVMRESRSSGASSVGHKGGEPRQK